MTQHHLKKQQSQVRSRLSVAVLAGLTLGSGLTQPVFAQAQRRSGSSGAAVPAAGSVAAAATAKGKGLNSIPPQEVLTELSARRLETLQKKAFDLYNIPEEQRTGMTALNALSLLTDKSKQIPAAERQKLIAKAVSGLNAILPTLKSARQLNDYAAVFLAEGAEGEANVMEYWGETPASQARLRPIAIAIDEMLARAGTVAEEEKAAIAKQMGTNVNSPLAAKWEELEHLQELVKFSRGMASYYKAMSIPATDETKADRIKAADDGIAVLKEYDNGDNPEDNVQPVVKTRIAKLHMVKGEPDVAKQFFTAVINGETKPKANTGTMYEARYFNAVADLMRGDVAGAKKQLAELEEWQKQNFNDPAVAKRLDAAADMLRYRILSTEAQMAQAGPEREKAQNAAINVLMQLAEKQPGLRSIIFRQLVERVGNQPVAQMEPLLLQAMVQKGVDEFNSTDPKAQQTFARAIEAGRELARRAAAGQKVPPQLVESSAFLVPYFLEKTGKKVEAANAFLDAIQKYPKNADAPNAFQETGHIVIGELRKDDNPDRGSAAVVQVYDRFLPVAINKPFGMTALAPEYAKRLYEQRRFKESADYYAMVPATDKGYLSAQYKRMLALTNVLDQTGPDKKPLVPQGAPRKALVTEIVTTAQNVRKLALDAAQSATDAKRKEILLSWAAGCTLTAAQVSASELKDAKQTLAILANFEQETQGLPPALVDPMTGEVLKYRVGSYLESGDFQKAADTLLQLISKQGGEKGQVFVLTVLQKLDEDYKKAVAAGDKERMRQLATNRAKLSTSLVDWAKKSPNPDINSRVYGYSIFDAEAKLTAAEMTGDKAQLATARKAFQRLLEPDMSALWEKQNANNPKFDKKFPHPNVLLGLGRAAFDQGDYDAAVNNLGRLLNNKKLGSATLEKVDPRNPGQVDIVDNEPFWEAYYKFLGSKFEIFNADKGNPKAAADYEDAKAAFKRLYIIQNPPGGEKWKDQFEEMRKKYIPDFDPKTLIPETQPAASQPASQPVPPVAAAPSTRAKVK
jgi:hypothetical protein